jgi:F-type H+/Na+-transporting ATPase subunit alpha
MASVVEKVARSLEASSSTLDLGKALNRRGVVTRVADDVAWAAGLDEVGSEELVRFDSGALGMALELGSGTTGIVLLSGEGKVAIGQGCTGVGQLPSLAVGLDALGRVLDPLGAPADGGPPLPGPMRPVFQPALEFIERKDVDEPLATGVMVLDGAIPVGRGQRELIIGDRNTGKTALALDVVTAQHAGDVACVYVLVGQPMSRIRAVTDALDRTDARGNSVVIAADASRTPGLQYLAPYAGATMAEALRDLGHDVVIVFDDLTKHADVYRELSLLLDRAPGREAYPGDIFYVHAELLERASARRTDLGGGSITALPIVETTDSDLSAYIPTNLISITDGQIYLDPARHERNERPAVDVGRSVSRIGGKAQPQIMRQAAKNLRIVLSRFEALEALTRIGLEVDASTARTIRRGRVLRALLRQPRFARRSWAEQAVALTAVTNGWLDEVPPESARTTLSRAAERMRADAGAMMTAMEKGTVPDGDWIGVVKKFVEAALPAERPPGRSVEVGREA